MLLVHLEQVDRVGSLHDTLHIRIELGLTTGNL